jgi:hypothetical protein
MGHNCGGSTNQGRTRSERSILSPSPHHCIFHCQDVSERFSPICHTLPNQHDTQAEHAHSGPRHWDVRTLDTETCEHQEHFPGFPSFNSIVLNFTSLPNPTLWSAKYSLAVADASVQGTSALPDKELILPNQGSWSKTAACMGVNQPPKWKECRPNRTCYSILPLQPRLPRAYFHNLDKMHRPLTTFPQLVLYLCHYLLCS